MRCPGCGFEVVEEAVFCHKCGARLEEGDEAFESEQRDLLAATDGESAAAEPPAGGSPTSPREKFQEKVAARREVDDEPETELWSGSYCAKAMIGAWMLSVVISVVLLYAWIFVVADTPWLRWTLVIAAIGLWIYQAGRFAYRRLNVSYRLTNQRFVHQSGILRRVTDRIEVIDMDDITFEQTVLERFVGTGTIRVTSSDRTHPELLLVGIENVKDVAGKMDDNRRSERRRRGLHIESI